MPMPNNKPQNNIRSGVIPPRLVQEMRQGGVITPWFEPYKYGRLSGGCSHASYDVRMSFIDGAKLIKSSNSVVNSAFNTSTVSGEAKIEYEEVHAETDGQITIPPMHFFMVVTEEAVHMPDNVVADLKPKSTCSRQGWTIYNGFVDNGFQGQIVIEGFNHNKANLILTQGQPIGQLVFYGLVDNAVSTYATAKGKYMNQTGVQVAL